MPYSKWTTSYNCTFHIQSSQKVFDISNEKEYQYDIHWLIDQHSTLVSKSLVGKLVFLVHPWIVPMPKQCHYHRNPQILDITIYLNNGFPEGDSVLLEHHYFCKEKYPLPVYPKNWDSKVCEGWIYLKLDQLYPMVRR